jgi:hypothetical protein
MFSYIEEGICIELVISNNDSTWNHIKIIETSTFLSPHNHNPFLGDEYKVFSTSFIKIFVFTFIKYVLRSSSSKFKKCRNRFHYCDYKKTFMYIKPPTFGCSLPPNDVEPI